MTVLPPSSSVAPWAVDQERDMVVFRLIKLAETALDWAFSLDDVDDRYRQWLKTARRKPRARSKAVPVTPASYELHIWRRDDSYTVSLHALAAPHTFSMVIDEEHFTAHIAVVYNTDTLELESARIEQFSGAPARAEAMARLFTAMLCDLEDSLPTTPDMGTDLDTLAQRLADGGLVADSGGAKSAVETRVAAMAHRLAVSGGHQPGGILNPDDEHFLEVTPSALWAIRDGFVARAAIDKPEERKALPAWQALLERQLEELRFKAERHHDWAIAMIERYQTDLLTMAHRPGIDVNTWQALVIALDRAKIDISPDVRTASLELTSGLPGNAPCANDIMRSMEEIVESGGGDPFRIAQHLFDAMTMMPPDFANVAIAMISTAPLPALRDVLPLVLLAPEAICRQAAATALEQMAADKRLTPAGLRRLIAVRSWLPEPERRSLDPAIRRARLAGIDCAPWPQGQLRTIQASVIDGSGCQSVLALAKDANRHLFTGILIKQGFGVRDVMVERGLPRREGEAMMTGVASQVLIRPVDRSYLDRMVQHALWTGAEAGRVPPQALLEVAEVLGAAEWRAQPLDPATEIAHLLDGVASELTTPAAQTAALSRSATWTAHEPLGGSWFEDDQAARTICARLARSPKKAVSALLDDVLEPRRALWAERMVLMALWTKVTPPDTTLPRWIDFALVARALHDGLPLTQIPLMSAIAKLTMDRAN